MVDRDATAAAMDPAEAVRRQLGAARVKACLGRMAEDAIAGLVMVTIDEAIRRGELRLARRLLLAGIRQCRRLEREMGA